MKKPLSQEEITFTWRNDYHMKKQLSHEETTLLLYEEITITRRNHAHMKKQLSHEEPTIT